MNKLQKIQCLLFKKKSFDFITSINGKIHFKQEEAIKHLTDTVVSEVLYGG